jgi:ABC-type nickel/cobalt efflux system permease component RcnA
MAHDTALLTSLLELRERLRLATAAHGVAQQELHTVRMRRTLFELGRLSMPDDQQKDPALGAVLGSMLAREEELLATIAGYDTVLSRCESMLLIAEQGERVKEALDEYETAHLTDIVTKFFAVFDWTTDPTTGLTTGLAPCVGPQPGRT